MVTVVPAVAGSVGATASKMQLGQEEEFVWHHAIRMGDGSGLRAPVYCDTRTFVNQVIIMIWAWGLKIVVRQKRKVAVSTAAAISVLDSLAVGLEALGELINIGLCRRNNTKEDVISHEVILRLSVWRITVDQHSKISVGEGCMRLDQSVKLAAISFLLQLQKDIFLVREESVDNVLGV